MTKNSTRILCSSLSPLAPALLALSLLVKPDVAFGQTCRDLFEAPILVTMDTAKSWASKLTTLEQIPEGTRFADLAALDAFLAESRAAQSTIFPFFKYETVAGYSVARQFPVVGNANEKDLRSPSGLHQVAQTGAWTAQGTIAELQGAQRLIAQKSYGTLVEFRWQNAKDVTFHGSDFLLFGFFAQRSPFADLTLAGQAFPDRGFFDREVLAKDPALEWNDDGSFTYWREGRRKRMLQKLEAHLGGKPLTVYRGQSNRQTLMIELLRSFGGPGFARTRSRLLQELRDNLARLKNESNAAYRSIQTEYERWLGLFADTNLSDEAFLRLAFSEFSKAPYLFTTPARKGFIDLNEKGYSGAMYRINLAALPESYKNRIFIAPDGEMSPFYAEIDFPLRSLEEALILARAIVSTEEILGNTY